MSAPAATNVFASAAITLLTAAVTLTPNAVKGILAADTCVLTPTVAGQTLIWAYSGACVTNGYVKA